MSAFLAGLIMFVMLVICLMLILLVLVQLPKKDAGAGLAFGSGAADALFGAGSGNALTKITKYGTVAFLVIAVLLGVIEDSINNASHTSQFMKDVQSTQSQPGGGLPMQPQPQPQAQPKAAGSNVLSTMPMLAPSSSTTAPAAPTTPVAPAPAAAGTNSAK